MPSSRWAAREAAPDSVTDWATIVGADFAAPGAASDHVDGLVPGWVVRPAGVGEVQAVVRAGPRLVASGLGEGGRTGFAAGRTERESASIFAAAATEPDLLRGVKVRKAATVPAC